LKKIRSNDFGSGVQCDIRRVPLNRFVMEEMLKYLIIAIVVGGAVPIIISHLTRKPPGKKDDDDAQ